MTTVVQRLLPAPLLSLLLLLLWLALNTSVHPAHIVLGALFGVLVPPVTQHYMSGPLKLRQPRVIARLLAIIIIDVLWSNVETAIRVLGPERALKPQFIWVPLAIRNGYGISALAAIVSMTPGTISADLTAGRDYLLVHVLHTDDPAAVIQSIKARYEAPLMEILQ